MNRNDYLDYEQEDEQERLERERGEQITYEHVTGQSPRATPTIHSPIEERIRIMGTWFEDGVDQQTNDDLKGKEVLVVLFDNGTARAQYGRRKPVFGTEALAQEYVRYYGGVPIMVPRADYLRIYGELLEQDPGTAPSDFTVAVEYRRQTEEDFFDDFVPSYEEHQAASEYRDTASVRRITESERVNTKIPGQESLPKEPNYRPRHGRGRLSYG